MTVKEVFDLRKAGKTVEAWQAIRPMYQVHQGHFTSLAYFWTAHDMLKLCLERGDTKTARQMLYAMTQSYATVDDADGKANTAVVGDALRVDSMVEGFNLLYFKPFFDRLKAEDWKPQQVNGQVVPSTGQRLITHLFKGLELRDADSLTTAMPYLQTALQRSPRNKVYHRLRARLYIKLGETDKAVATYRQILQQGKDAPSAYALSKLTADRAEKIALLCRAIIDESREQSRFWYRLTLARLLKDVKPAAAAHELLKCQRMAQQLSPKATSPTPSPTHNAQQAGLAPSKRQMDEMASMLRALASVTPASDAEQRDFYIRAISYLRRLWST